MQINVPSRLQNSIKDKIIKNNTLTCNIKCPSCDSDTFHVFNNDLSDQINENVINEFLKKHPLLSYEINRDKNNRLFLRGLLFDIPVTKKIYITQIQNVTYEKVVKAKCSNCDKEIILFDSKQDGYDAVIDKLEDKMKKSLKFKAVTKYPQKINLKINNFKTFDEFKKETELLDINDYYNGYASIIITLINPKTNKKQIILNEETR